MTTRAVMITEIMDELRRSSATDTARVTKAISAAIKRYQPKRFYFNESRDVTFSTVVDQTVYSFVGASPDITTSFFMIDNAIIEESNNDWPLNKEYYSDLELLNDGNATSNRPFSYAFINQSLVLYPKPDQVYTVRLTGHIKLAEPASDDEADNQWFTEAYELIKSRAKLYLFGHVFPNPGQASVMVSAERDAANILSSATESKAGVGNIIPTQF